MPHTEEQLYVYKICTDAQAAECWSSLSPISITGGLSVRMFEVVQLLEDYAFSEGQ